jgi:Tfp pilus assembly protein PilN
MRTTVASRLNLASRPVRNQRFFRLALGLLGGACLIAVAAAGWFLVRYAGGARRARAETVQLELKVRTAREGARQLTRSVENAERALGSTVALVNDAILRKHFSWTGLLSDLETSLPGRSYITSLTPGFAGEGSVVLKIGLVSSGLEDLMAFWRNLDPKKFFDIRIDNEMPSPQGQLMSEISVRYARTD